MRTLLVALLIFAVLGGMLVEEAEAQCRCGVRCNRRHECQRGRCGRWGWRRWCCRRPSSGC